MPPGERPILSPCLNVFSTDSLLASTQFTHSISVRNSGNNLVADATTGRKPPDVKRIFLRTMKRNSK